ncbi:hypothetical protein AVEN_253601-1 [Araneus ventricosus]|uniref:Uncharacterized protein n=1 Tax=Araneus ventricosus TaxID=182803 RepID=A0A4Y2CB26_ARAVE|nr:hypothetical protein AVEN_253601-1 [Araneus ventricosus]
MPCLTRKTDFLAMDSEAWRRMIGRHQLGRGRHVSGSIAVHQLDATQFSIAEKCCSRTTVRCSCVNVKLDIHVKTAPRKWGGSTPDHYNFQSIHLGGLFTEAPCKPQNRSLRFPRATAPPPPPAFRTGSLFRPAFTREPHSPSPRGLHFVVFAFVREPCPLPHGRISVL